MHDHQFLTKIPIFTDCSENELEEIAEYLLEKTVPSGDAVFFQGDAGNELFIVKNGRVKSIIQAAGGGEKEIASFGTGDYFGEMSIIDNCPRSATCRAVETTVLYSMAQAGFFRLMLARPRIAIRLMYRMLNITTLRLTATSRFLSDMVRWGNDASRRAITDEVTGAYNRRYLDRVLGECYAAARASGGSGGPGAPVKTFSLIMMDLDHFRAINEKYNHEVGNRVLCHAVGRMKQALAATDILARYGGDEFTILCPDTPLSAALQRAEAIRKGIEELVVNDPDARVPLSVTTSQGIANFPETGTDLETIQKQADRALYKAKEDGRNRVVPATLL